MRCAAMAVLAFGSLIVTNAPEHDTIKMVNPIPVKLMPPGGHVLLLKAKAVGAQIYVCKAKADDPDGFEWVLKPPDADLLRLLCREGIARLFAELAWTWPVTELDPPPPGPTQRRVGRPSFADRIHRHRALVIEFHAGLLFHPAPNMRNAAGLGRRGRAPALH